MENVLSCLYLDNLEKILGALEIRVDETNRQITAKSVEN